MAAKTKYLKFLEIITSLTEEEKRTIADFEERFKTIKKHRKHISELVYLSTKLRKKFLLKTKKRIERLIKLICKEIFQKFEAVLQKEIMFDLKEKKLMEKEIELTEEAEELMAHDYKKIKVMLGAGGLRGRRTEEKLKQILLDLEEATKKEREELSIDQYLEKLLNTFTFIIDEERVLLKQEKDYLQTYIFKQKIMTPELYKNLKETEDELKGIIEQLIKIMRKEKEEFIDPFNKLLREKTKLDKIVASLATRNRITVKDIKKDLRMFTKPTEVIKYQAELFNHLDKIDKKAIKFLSKVAKRSATVSEEERLRLGKEAKIAFIDALTGVGTRFYYEQRIAEILLSYERTKRPFSLVMADIDSFKEFNDIYGYVMGDTVLAKTAEFVKKTIRRTDKVFRWGGEEFIVIPPETTKEEAMTIANNIRKVVERESIQMMLKENRLITEVEEKDKKNAITLSFGVASCPDDGTDKKRLFESVNKAIKRAKREGKNKVVAAKGVKNKGLSFQK